ncbi:MULTISPECIES: hypothetical protein [Pontibacter]|uniref:Uncharacterized protein n=1 Tax=Pontibacter lucknowensis TaxID=1077936 RepID=A0A1N6Y4M7_9BACT|nr:MULTISPECIES: hypothetical protein [Pontibacter]EJF08803.1 hypothetical protein O71_18723 [Pontibacter sp. BAB1700]SIR09530.1 hypothetical protein SAMN05421545_2258 [Pontibacter lucknowensis]
MKNFVRSFYDFNRDSPQERQERNQLYPELAKFHIALREEMSEEEYQEFFRAEKEANKHLMIPNPNPSNQWIRM